MQISDLAKEHLYYLASPFSTPTWKEVSEKKLGKIVEPALMGDAHATQPALVNFNNYFELAQTNDSHIKQIRYEMAEFVGAYLLNEGFFLLEPIAMTYHKSKKFKMPHSFEYWQHRDKRMIAASFGVIVCCFDGWEHSLGVMQEIEYAKEIKRPVYLLEVDFKSPTIITDIKVA